MELFKCLFGVVVVAVSVCSVTSQHHWAMPQQQHQPPLPPQQPQQQSSVLPPAAPFDKCQVEEGEKIQCGARDITTEQCENINCCYDGQQCYYGKAGIHTSIVSCGSSWWVKYLNECNWDSFLISPLVTVQCTRDGQFVVVLARDATVPPIDVESVSLLETNDPLCSPVDYTSTFAIFQFPVTACGTTIKVMVQSLFWELCENLNVIWVIHDKLKIIGTSLPSWWWLNVIWIQKIRWQL